MNPSVKTQGNLSYVGNPDYRGYLNYLGSTGNAQARTLLGYVGNTGQFGNLTGVQQGDVNNLKTANTGLYNQFQQALMPQAPTINIPGVSIPAPYVPPSAPYIDTNSIFAQSKAQAGQTVNPLYDKYLNQYLQNEAANKTARQAENDASIKNLQAQEANALQGNELTRKATTENTAAVMGNINNQEQNFQQLGGLQFDQQRQQMLGAQGQSGLAGSGLGQQADATAQQGRNIKEAAQEGQYTYSREQHELLKNQTFEQLANNDSLAKLKETEGENQANFSLADYLRQASDAEFKFQTQNEQQRQSAINSSTQDLYRQNIVNNISQYKGNLPLYSAAYQAYVR